MKKITFAAVLLFSITGYSWGPVGHRVVAEIAQRNLNPSAASHINALLGGYTLADVANWADDRSVPQVLGFLPLHYADILEQYKTYQEAPVDPKGDVVVSIRTLVNYLSSSLPGDLSAVGALRQIDRVTALKLLVHFVGDVHQPLHVIESKNKAGQLSLGGNRFVVNWMKKWKSNIHSVWDDEMVDFEKLSYTEYASLLNHASETDKKTWGDTPIIEWANESLSYRAQVYTFPDMPKMAPDIEIGTEANPALISYGYTTAVREIMRKRLLQGGIRLAALLNMLF